MWPLIIPPIVFVLCLGFLVWFLSKKSADPGVQERLALAGKVPKPKRFLFFFKEETGIRILERILQHLKLVSLKFHNRFQEFSNFLRRKREQATEWKNTPPAQEEKPLVLSEEDKDGFWDRWHRRHRATLEPVTKEEITSEPENTGEGERVTINNVAEGRGTASRFSGLRKKVTALSPTSTEYFSRNKRTIAPPRKLLSEEELIDRIAKNPKDAASYEELGDYYMANENLEDAKACYRQVIKLSPLNREVKEKVRKLERLLVQREKHKG